VKPGKALIEKQATWFLGGEIMLSATFGITDTTDTGRILALSITG
jgi:hypothetical protein